MTHSKKNETIKVTSAVGANNPAEPAPTPAERNALAKAARDRLRTATDEAFPRSQQYRPVQDGTRNVGSGEA